MPKKKSTGNGSGTVYPRKNKEGKIIGYLGSYFGPDGKRRYVSAKDKTACRTKLRQAMGDADQGLVFDAGTLTVGQYMDKCYRTSRARCARGRGRGTSSWCASTSNPASARRS